MKTVRQVGCFLLTFAPRPFNKPEQRYIMFGRLQKKWKVSATQLALIIATFAIGGSLTGYVARKLMPIFSIDSRWLWVIVYILFVTVLWPLAVLLISIPFGQFSFFRKYIRKIGHRMGIGIAPKTAVPPVARIAIFASGAGSNAQKIIDRFRNHSKIRVGMIVCNNPSAGVIQIAKRENIPLLLIEKERFFRGDAYRDDLKNRHIDLVVLAGFLWKIPLSLIQAYPGKIINIHPALLPKYGGKGMYGHHVHEAVLAAGDRESGISIHAVDEIYDHGKILFQAKCAVMPDDTTDSLAARIHGLEHEHFGRVIEEILLHID